MKNLRSAYPYVYQATVKDVIDGDTLGLVVDLGFAITATCYFRLAGCNARELSRAGGWEARNHLAELLPTGTHIKIASVKVDKYGGRYDAAVMLEDGTDLVAQLVEQQWAVPWNGHGQAPVPPWPRTVTS